MEEACVSFTLLSFLLHGGGGGGGGGSSSSSSSSSVCSFSFREYVDRVTNFYLWFSLVSVTVLLLRKLIALFSLWAQGSRIPGPPARLSFLPGHGRRSNRRSARDLSGYLSEMHEQYGPIVRLWFSPTKLLISVTDVAVINEILLKAKDKFPLPGSVFPLAFGRSNIFVSSFEKETKNHLISQEEPFGNILGLMSHECLTITNLVCSILTRLVLHPELQEKIFSEITEVQKTTSKRDSYDVERMHFLLGTVYESARLLPPGPLLQRCSLNHDLTLKSTITVPVGTILVVPLQLVQMESSIWGVDACQFNPHRFVSKAVNEEGLSEENGISELRNNAAYLPFGSGSRSCIGQNIAILGISKLFASLLQEYEIRLEPHCREEMKLTTNECLFQLRPSPKTGILERKK